MFFRISKSYQSPCLSIYTRMLIGFLRVHFRGRSELFPNKHRDKLYKFFIRTYQAPFKQRGWSDQGPNRLPVEVKSCGSEHSVTDLQGAYSDPPQTCTDLVRTFNGLIGAYKDLSRTLNGNPESEEDPCKS